MTSYLPARALYLGSAGSLQKNFKTGSILFPSFYRNERTSINLSNELLALTDIQDPSVFSFTSHTSVRSIFEETEPWLQQWATRVDSVDVELGYVAEFARKYSHIGILLVVSDVLSEKKGFDGLLFQRELYKEVMRGLDLIRSYIIPKDFNTRCVLVPANYTQLDLWSSRVSQSQPDLGQGFIPLGVPTQGSRSFESLSRLLDAPQLQKEMYRHAVDLLEKELRQAFSSEEFIFKRSGSILRNTDVFDSDFDLYVIRRAKDPESLAEFRAKFQQKLNETVLPALEKHLQDSTITMREQLHSFGIMIKPFDLAVDVIPIVQVGKQTYIGRNLAFAPQAPSKEAKIVPVLTTLEIRPVSDPSVAKMIRLIKLWNSSRNKNDLGKKRVKSFHLETIIKTYCSAFAQVLGEKGFEETLACVGDHLMSPLPSPHLSTYNMTDYVKSQVPQIRANMDLARADIHKTQGNLFSSLLEEVLRHYRFACWK